MDDLTGRAIKGYELRELIGAGGFGAVYKAFQPAVGRDVAVKVILSSFANHPEFIRRFEAEAQLVARLEHFHIVPLYDYWRDHEGAFLVMRWLRGGSVRALLSDGALPILTVTRLLDQIAAALAVAHRHKVIHRDMKPDNVLLDEEGNGYLADFGIAKDLGTNVNMTSQDTMLGSPAYYSPEVIEGKNPLTPASDIYALGVMLWEMLVGRHPYEGLSPTTLMLKHLKEPLPSLQSVNSSLPTEFDDILLHATEKVVADRYQDVLALATDFRHIVANAGITMEDGMSVSAFLSRPSSLTQMVTTEVSLDIPNPYKGLKAFQEGDALDFNGRDGLITKLLDELNKDKLKEDSEKRLVRFLAVTGPSGSGKSSVVKAGLLPALRNGALPGSEKWYIVDMVPGNHPMEALDHALIKLMVSPVATLQEILTADRRGLSRAVNRALPDDKAELLLVIDQFEEVFTQTEDESERVLFLNSILTAVTDPRSRLRVIITLRADFFDRPLYYVDFGQMLTERNVVVLPMNAAELELAIKQPAERVGVIVEPPLLAQMLTDVTDQLGALPLLQYALYMVFERRAGRKMLLTAYTELGGTTGALARRADELFSALDPETANIGQQLFLRLVTLGEGAEDTRRRAYLDELLSLGGEHGRVAIQRIVNEFGSARLLTFDSEEKTRRPTVEVAHEALIRQWKRLRSWLDQSREDLRRQRNLAATAAEWEKEGQDPSFLLRGSRLDQINDWLEEDEKENQASNAQVAPKPETVESETETPKERIKLQLNEKELEFLEASRAERRREEAIEAARVKREEELELRSRQRLRALVVVMSIAAVVSAVLGLFALSQADAAQRSEKQAINNAEEAQSLALASSAQLALGNNNTELALALSTAAERTDIALVQRALYETAYAPGIRRRLTGHTDEVQSVAYSVDGRTGVSASADKTLILWNLATGEIVRHFGGENLEGHGDLVRSVVYSPDGTQILSADNAGAIMLWDLATGEIVNRFEGHTGAVNQAIFTSAGEQILSVSDDGTMILWNVTDATLARTFNAPENVQLKSVAVNPDGEQAITGSLNGPIFLWNLETGELIDTLSEHENTVWSLAYSPNGTRALSGSSDRQMLLWNMTTRQPVRSFIGHSDFIWSVAFSPNGRFALSGSEDNRMILWNVDTGELVRRLEGHNGKVFAVAFSANGTRALSGSSDQSVIVWDLEAGEFIARYEGHTDWVNVVAYNADGTQALTGSSDGTLMLWDLQTHSLIRQIGANENLLPIWSVAFSPDGRYVLSGLDDATIILWDTETGALVRRYLGHSNYVNRLQFSQDGRTFVSASGDFTAILWDTETGVAVRRFEGHEADVLTVQYSPDQRQLLTGSSDMTIKLWDTETGELIRTFVGHEADIQTVDWSPDGRTFASGSNDATVILWDVATGSVIRRFREHTSTVSGVEFSPDGNTLVSASLDSTLIRWNVVTGAAINRFESHTESVTSMAFSPDGRRIISGSADETMIEWRIDTLAELLMWTTENRYIRELTCAERERYRLDACDAQGVFPTRTALPTFALVSEPTISPTVDLTRTTETPEPTITPTVPPSPTPTATPIPDPAQVGTQRGEIVIGDRDAWMYMGRADEVLILSLVADNPSGDFSLAESVERGLLDTRLIVFAPDGTVIAENDDIQPGITNSLIEDLTLPVDGVYVIEVRGYADAMGGPYTLEIQSSLVADSTNEPTAEATP